MEYTIALKKGVNSSTPLNGYEIVNVRFWVEYHIKAVLYQELFQFIGCVRNVRIGSFFNLQCNNALFEFLFVMVNQKLDLAPGAGLGIPTDRDQRS